MRLRQVGAVYSMCQSQPSVDYQILITLRPIRYYAHAGTVQGTEIMTSLPLCDDPLTIAPFQ